MRPDRTVHGDTPHLCDDNAATVARSQRHLHRTEVSAFLLETQVPAFVGRARPDYCDIRLDRLEVKPVFALKKLA